MNRHGKGEGELTIKAYKKLALGDRCEPNGVLWVGQELNLPDVLAATGRPNFHLVRNYSCTLS
jgi:hypothetical protein